MGRPVRLRYVLPARAKERVGPQDEEAAVPSFEDVYRDNLPGVWSYVRARVPGVHEAEDVAAEVFERALGAWDRYDPSRGTVGAWLYRIAHNTVVDWWRRRRPGGMPRESPVEVPDTPGPGADEAVLRNETVSRLRTALRELSDREREAIALRFGGGLRSREVGDVLGVSEGAAKMLVHRAVAKLRAVMADD